MRGKSSSNQAKQREMEIDNLKEQPHLSGAYIRSLVKHLSHNSRNKESLNNPNLDENVTIDRNSNETQQSQPPQKHKKQVRRRLHTTRPYQERLLDMAEARREIVTALKFHRASMKQQQQQQEKTQMEEVKPLQPSVPLDLQQKGTPKSRSNQDNHDANNSNYLESFSGSNFSYYPSICTPYNTFLVHENLVDFSLPNQALGLNLNLQDFNNLETTTYNSRNCPSIYSSSSSASSSSSPATSCSAESFPSMTASQEGASSMMADYMDIHQLESGMHPRMDEKEIAEIRSIGDQHQMELNDTLNLASSAWWFKYLKSIEMCQNDPKNDYRSHPFDEIMEVPAWLNANESCLQQHLQDYYSDDYFKDPSLPRMDIEEIQGMDDGEWLSLI